MSIKTYNEETKRWEQQSSLHASSIKVRDTLGNFKSEIKTVENCLEETQETITNLKKDIKYIYENGTIGGGGGGGGGSVFPKIELNSPTDIIVKTENQFTVSYFFNSPNPGEGTANYVITKKNSVEAPILDIRKTVKQGRVNHIFDPIPSGEYELSISVTDQTGIGSNNIICNITCGALEITTNEETNRDVRLGSPLTITYKLSSIFKDPVDVDITMPDGQLVKEKKTAGTYKIELPAFDTLGVKNLTIKGTCNEVESNTLKFTFIVTDATTMFISSTFEGGQFRQDENVSINYRISLMGARQFLTDVYLNDQLHESGISSKNGHNFYTLNGLQLGTYKVRFECKTLETVNPIKASLEVPEFEIVSSDFRTYQFSKDSLVLSLDARKGKSNNQDSSKVSVWEDTEPGVATVTKLHNFAFNFLNGWVNSETGSDTNVDGLKFSGKSYAEIDLKPLNENLQNGLTIEVRYKNFDIGADKDGNYSCIFDCFKGTKFTGKGIMIDSKEAFARTSYADSIANECNENEWVTQTFVINTQNNEILLYTNGCISSYSKMDALADMLVDKKITLGARNEDGILYNSNCSIQTVRIYNRSLDDLEVFKNYVSDLPLEKQDEIIAIHEGQKQIPTLKLKFDESALGNATATTTVQLEYSDPNDPSKNIILENSIIQKQGTTSQTYPVSNYTIKLYDAGLPFDYAPKDDWVPENIFTLKADYMDSSHANNTGIAAYASEVFKRLGIKNPAQKENDKVKNTIDGFMINLYVNGTNRGLYNFNTDRYGAKNYGLSNTSFKTVALSYEANSNTGNATGFHTQDWNLIKGAFKVRYFKNENDQNKYLTYDQETGEMVLTQGVHGEFAKLIKWINEAGQEAVEDTTKRFYSEFKEHLDLNHTLLYMLIVEIFGLMDNFEKNMVLTYFGEQYNQQTGMLDEIWYPQLYDLDSSVGLSNNGELKYQPCVNFTQEEGMPADHQYNGTKSLLWAGLKKQFFKELKDMYAQMRRTGLLSFDTLVEYYQGKTIDKVSPYLYSVDARLKYINPSADGNGKDTYYHFCKGRRIEFTKKWLKNRITFLDSIYEYGNESNPDGEFWKYIQARYLARSTSETTFTIKAKSTTPIFVVVVDDSMKTDGKKYFINNDKFYNITIPMNNSADGAMFGITFGPKLTNLEFSNNIKLNSLYLEHARSLQELDIPNNRDLINIVLNNCDNLRKFNVKGCIKLGSVLGAEKVNFTNCPNIKDINISNTALSGFVVNDNGGVIENLICDSSNIETFILKNQPYINALNITECYNLKKFEISNCPRIVSVEFPYSKLETFRVVDCPNIQSINVSNNPFLNALPDKADPENRPNFLIENCSKLNKIVMSGLSNKDMTMLDLINVENIEYLDITKCSFLSEVRVSDGATKLTTFKCNNSNIQNFIIGRNGSTVSYLDLGQFPNLNSGNFENCKNLKEVRNCNFGRQTPTSGGAMFRYCSNLVKVTGYLRLNSIGGIFDGCSKLESLTDDIHLDDVTSATWAFNNCAKIPFSLIQKIVRKMPNIKDLSYTFLGCNSAVTSDSSPFPENFFENNPLLEGLTSVFGGSNFQGPFPINIYKNLTKLKTISSPFDGCSMTIPLVGTDSIFSTLTELTTLHSPFSGIKLMKMPNKNLLVNNTKLVSVRSLFNGKNTMLKADDAGEFFINGDYFKNNPLITNIEYLFYNCSALIGKIPETLFANQKNITTIQEFLLGCSGVTGQVPANLFPCNLNDSKLKNVYGAFAGSGITGNIPNELFEQHNHITTMGSTFANCTKLGTGIPESEVKFPNKIFRGKTALTNISAAFKGCSNYAISFDENNEDDNKLISDNDKLTNINELFYGCSKLVGTLAPDMFNVKDINGEYKKHAITTAESVFYGTNISGRIPPNFFKSFGNVTTLANFFYSSNKLIGGFPYGLFDNCLELKNLSNFVGTHISNYSAFGTNRDENLEHSRDEVTGDLYVFNKDLFIHNAKLENITSFMYHTSINGKLHLESFLGNPELKFFDSAFRDTAITVDVDRTLFMGNPKATTFSYMFYGVSGGVVIQPDFISRSTHGYLHRNPNGTLVNKNFAAMFYNTNATGTAPRLWEEFPNAVGSSGTDTCFGGTNVDNLDEIPPITWK